MQKCKTNVLKKFKCSSNSGFAVASPPNDIRLSEGGAKNYSESILRFVLCEIPYVTEWFDAESDVRVRGTFGRVDRKSQNEDSIMVAQFLGRIRKTRWN